MTNEEFDRDETEMEEDAVPAEILRSLSPLAWARYGATSIAYVRPVLVNGQPACAIHAADGTPIGAAPDVPLAMAAILQHGMGAALVH